MSKYYYFVASLPTINFDSKSAMSVEDFLSSCDEMLSKKDGLIVRELIESEEQRSLANQTCEVWTNFDNAFKNQMACCRAKKQGKDPMDYIRGNQPDDVELEEVTEDALKQENLLDAEKIIDKKRWQYMEDLEQYHFFDFANIIIYGLKLQILEKYKRVSSDEGKQVLEELKELEVLTDSTLQKTE